MNGSRTFRFYKYVKNNNMLRQYMSAVLVTKNGEVLLKSYYSSITTTPKYMNADPISTPKHAPIFCRDDERIYTNFAKRLYDASIQNRVN
uniref:Uncharacterized protein n=1 Tax=Acrobeloides nanus TaxID=290746 RepID=A0A914E508_9BILA